MSRTIREYYDAYWGPSGFSPSGLRHPRMESLIEPLLSGADRCLDYGCGDGSGWGLWLSRRTPTYIGFDVSAAAVDLARARGLDAHVLREDTLPLEDECVDVAICSEVFEHMLDPLAVAIELHRVLRDGGSLVASVPNVAYWRRRIDLMVAGRWNGFGDDLSVAEPWRDPHIRFFTRDRFGAMLERAGFADVSVGAHGGALSRDVPGLRRVAPRSPGSTYRRVEALLPSLAGARLDAVARKDRTMR
mgnify:CR=1 FL=1